MEVGGQNVFEGGVWLGFSQPYPWLWRVEDHNYTLACGKWVKTIPLRIGKYHHTFQAFAMKFFKCGHILLLSGCRITKAYDATIPRYPRYRKAINKKVLDVQPVGYSKIC